MIKLVRWLDQKALCHYRLWEFSLRNFVRWFPWFFMLRVGLRHPILWMRGFAGYRRMVRETRDRPLSGHFPLHDIQRLFGLRKREGLRFIVAPGFCMKPYDKVHGASTCPSGHGNHDCFVLDHPALLQKEQSRWPAPCDRCNIGKLALAAFSLDADFYIMTSALDIARDLFIPAVEDTGARLGVFLLCPYTSEAFTFGMTISRMQGMILTFDEGNCMNHRDFTRADVGIKDQQTYIEQTVFERLLLELDRVGTSKQMPDACQGEYKKVQNVYFYSKKEGSNDS